MNILNKKLNNSPKKLKSYKLQAERGLGIVEIIVVTAIILTAYLTILQMFNLQARTERVKREELAAYALLAEALEAARSVRDDSWSNLSSLTIGADYYPVISAGAWTLSTTDPGPIDGFTLWVVLDDVRRDANDDIVSLGGSVDADTLRLRAFVEWQSGGDIKSRDLITYFTNWQENL